MTEDKLLIATHSGTIKIIDQELSCAVLKNGTRILSVTAVFCAFSRKQGGGNNITYLSPHDQQELKLPAFIGANNLFPYITKEIQATLKPIEYLDSKFTISKGYNAEILPILCDLYLQARKDGVLHPKQLPLVEISEIMMRSFAKVGIAALIDEATGYQNVRSKDALQVIVDKYFAKEFACWFKRFPDEFYRQIFRLKGWTISDVDFRHRPAIIGHITNDLVYSRLAPNIVKELQVRNPKTTKRHRKYAHHQLLTNDAGHPALSHHLHAIIAFMKTATNWEDFLRMLEIAFPKKNEQTLLEIEKL